MAKIILLYLVALFMIFQLFWSHGNATTPRKLGVRHNAVTSLSNIGDTTFGGLGSARKLGSRSNAVTSLINTNEATFGGFEDQDSSISSSLAHETHITATRKLGARQFGITCLQNTNCAISGGSSIKGGSGRVYSPILSSSAHANAGTPSTLGSRHNAVTSLPNTNEATFDGSENQDSPILSSPAHTNAITILHLVDPIIFTNEPNARKHRAHQNPIIITSLSNTNEVTNTGESRLHSSPISSSPTQTNFLLPRSPGSGRVYSPISSTSAHANAAIPRTLGSHQNAITKLPHTNEVTFDGSENQDSPISSLSTHTNTITIPYVDPSIFTNEEIARKQGAHENPIIITSLPNTNEVANSGELGLHSSPISSSPTQTTVVIPRDPGSGHDSLIIN